MSFADHVTGYRRRLDAALAALDQPALEALAEALGALRDRGGRLYVAGNGGSAATAAHLANDLGAGLGAAGLDVVCLSDSATALTAAANDWGVDQVFVRQLAHRLRGGDLLLVLSASGNSENILRAMALARERRATVASITGFDGGAAARAADIAIQIPTALGDYGPAEDTHLAIDHILTSWLRRGSPRG